MKAVFFFDKFFLRLKGKRAVLRQILPGAPLKLKFAIWGPEEAILKPKLAIFKQTLILKLKPAILKLKPTILKLKPIILKLKPTISKLKPIILKLHLGACLKHTTEVGILGLALNPKKWTIGWLTSRTGEGWEKKGGLPRTQRPNNNIHQKPLRS